MTQSKKLKNLNLGIGYVVYRLNCSCNTCKESYCCRNQVGIQVSQKEWEILSPLITEEIEQKARVEQTRYSLIGKYSCPFLSDKGLCSVYEVRPTVCSLYCVNTPPTQCDTSNGLQEVEYFNPAEILNMLDGTKFGKHREEFISGRKDMLKRFRERIGNEK